uniref:Claudin n=1 Tax=Macrostomum lignano TaxID=282301 RepID=A0A1I8F520_9PLAT
DLLLSAIKVLASACGPAEGLHQNCCNRCQDSPKSFHFGSVSVLLFSDRWMLVEVALKETDKIRVTTYVTVFATITTTTITTRTIITTITRSWSTRKSSSSQRRPPSRRRSSLQHRHQKPTPTPAGATKSKSLAPASDKAIALTSSAGETGLASAHLTEKTLYHLSDSHSGALIAIRVLLFVCIGLTFGALFLLLVTACNDTNVIRHRYKEKRLAFTLAGMCAMALVLTIICWSVFLGTVFHSVQQYGHAASNSLNAGFVCSILATVCLIVSIVLSACTVDEE